MKIIELTAEIYSDIDGFMLWDYNGSSYPEPYKDSIVKFIDPNKRYALKKIDYIYKGYSLPKKEVEKLIADLKFNDTLLESI